MATNDQILLEKVFEESRANVAPTMVPDDYFEIFSAEQTLKPYDLSYEEIAVVTEQSLAAVKTQIHRAKLLLGEGLQRAELGWAAD